MPIMREGLILHRSSGLASPALQTGSPGTHIPWRPTPAASVPLIFPLGVTPDPRPGSRCGAASPRPRPSSLPLFLGRGMAPAHVPAPPAPESGGGAGGAASAQGRRGPCPPQHPLPPTHASPQFACKGPPGALCPPRVVPSSSSLPRFPPQPRQWLTPPAYGMR